MYIMVHKGNMWFLPSIEAPVIELQKSMKEDGYWDDCDVVMDDIVDLKHYTVANMIGHKLQQAYNTTTTHSEQESDALIRFILNLIS